MVTINMNSGVYKCLILCIKLSILGAITLILEMAFNKYGVPSDDYITWAKSMRTILFTVSGMSGIIGIVMKSILNALDSLEEAAKDIRSQYNNWKRGFTK